MLLDNLTCKYLCYRLILHFCVTFKLPFRQVCHVACNDLIWCHLSACLFPVAVQLLTSCCLSAGSSTWDAVVVGAASLGLAILPGHVRCCMDIMEKLKKCREVMAAFGQEVARSLFDCVSLVGKSYLFFAGPCGVCRPAETHDGQDRQDPYIARGNQGGWSLHDYCIKWWHGNAKFDVDTTSAALQHARGRHHNKLVGKNWLTIR